VVSARRRIDTPASLARPGILATNILSGKNRRLVREGVEDLLYSMRTQGAQDKEVSTTRLWARSKNVTTLIFAINPHRLLLSARFEDSNMQEKRIVK
jgi:hypothetical protein